MSDDPGVEQVERHALTLMREKSPSERRALYHALADAGHPPANRRLSQLAKALAARFAEAYPEKVRDLGLEKAAEELQDLTFEALEA